MPYITTRGSSTASGTGFSFFELPDAADLQALELAMWFYPGADAKWENQANWFLNETHTVPAVGLPKSYTDVVLLADADVETYGPGYADHANTIELGKSLDVNGHTLYILGHNPTETDEWIALSDEEKDAQLSGDAETPIAQYSCPDAVTIDIAGVIDSKADTRPLDADGFAYALVVPSGHLVVVNTAG
jgi:hypothetical protein